MISRYTTTGRRENNEDSFTVRNFDSVWLIAVADGVGGHAAGEIASKTAILELENTIEELFSKLDSKPEMVLREGCARANNRILDLSQVSPRYHGMATTLVATLISRDNVVLANIGDSRAYLIQGDEIRQVTRDHSLVQEMVDRGIIRPEDAFGHPQSNIITKALGLEKQIEPDIYRLELKKGDTLLLCSDGLSDTLRDEEIKRVLKEGKTAKNLAAAALEKGAQDNITVITYSHS